MTLNISRTFQRLATLGWMLLAPALAHAEMFGPIAGKVFGSGSKALVLVAHGDSGPDYITGFAQQIAAQNPGVTVIQMARPGYKIRGTGASKGSSNGGRDHHTKRNSKLLGQGVVAAANAYPHKELLVVGHSGGANQFGVIIATHPGVIDTAILVSGPFDVKLWRTMRGKGPWPRSQSPKQFLKSVPASTKIIAATGSSDSNTRPALARAYVKKAKALGKNATYVEIPGAGHGFRGLHAPVLKLVAKEVRN
jgi:pimeloyl-ACP methyl ester carboxylesterase